ncbi:hypothetical protein FC90_GL001545 [Latilactobacillus graminis DSM 20719]|uniref:Uncharacterized protein n=1 Tax=Latilactobacillus graminis DSM 20719 TaxID=1423752 RepID=A0AA89KZU5_9LACO|nr:hypothetical protein FC90_GL001545 [Latilactobacillus graminis DSM 20719]
MLNNLEALSDNDSYVRQQKVLGNFFVATNLEKTIDNPSQLAIMKLNCKGSLPL